jgi:hypothetical protein
VDAMHWCTHLGKVFWFEPQVREHAAQGSGWNLFRARRPQRSPAMAKGDQAMPGLAAGRIELEPHAPGSGQTAELAQQFVARHDPWMAIAGSRVKAAGRFERRGLLS